MAITGYDGTRLTPKQKAAELIESEVSKLLEFSDTWEENMTSREVEKVYDQLLKYQTRIDKVIGYTR